MRRTNVIAAAGIMLMACGGGVHLTESHGRAYREAVQRQTANPNAAAQKRPNRGLDSQEAAVIADGYRKALAPKGAAPAEEQMLIIAPTRAPAGNMPPPSVPPAR